MFSYLKTSMLSVLFIMVSFSLLAGDVKVKTKIPMKTKQGKSVTTKNGQPVYFKNKSKK
ncbi:MAG: hypothetical protein H0X29_02655 [Parachlamydiaceae bacterium]|nr:hypothetical protein [Parachlamydiaceae bacterium]